MGPSTDISWEERTRGARRRAWLCSAWLAGIVLLCRTMSTALPFGGRESWDLTLGPTDPQTHMASLRDGSLGMESWGCADTPRESGHVTADLQT